MPFKIDLTITSTTDTLKAALALVASVSVTGFKIGYLSVQEDDDANVTTNADAPITAIEAAVPAAAEAATATAETAPKSRAARATKPAAAPAPAPASAAPASPAPAPVTATHADLRAILVPVATTGAEGSKRVTKFIRDNGYLGTVDAIPAADLPALIVKAKEVFA